MSFGELRDYIDTLRAAGYRVDRLTVQLHQKLAYPWACRCWPGCRSPSPSAPGERGTVGGIALALVLGMAYFGLMAFVTRLGEASLVPPVLAAWTPAVVFGLLADQPPHHATDVAARSGTSARRQRRSWAQGTPVRARTAPRRSDSC